MFIQTVFKQIAKRATSISVGVFLGISLLTAAAPLVSAAPAPPDPVPTPSTSRFYSQDAPTQAKLWSEYSAATKDCNFAVASRSSTGGRSEQDIAAGKWFNTSTTYVGHHVEPTDGKVSCNNENNWFSDLLDAAGYTDNHTGAAKQVFNVKNGIYYYTNQSATKLRTLLATGLFGSTNSTPSYAPYYVAYEILMTNFTANRACNATPFTTEDAAAGKTKAPIYVFDPATKTAKIETYVYDKKFMSKGIGVGFGLNIGGADDGVIQCQTIASQLGNKSYAENRAAYAAATGDSNTGATGSSNDGTNPDPCGSVNPAALRWIACPLVELSVEATKALDATIQNFLFTPTNQIFTSDMETAWKVFRNLGVALILIAGLVMVVSQAMSLEIFDAYTIRKVLPRLLIATIGITLSWPILMYVITFFNDLGLWSKDLILTPFNDIGASHATAESILASAGGLLAGVYEIAIPLGIGGVLSLLWMVIVFALIGLLVLTIRQLVIMVAVLMAPLAIAAYILPGTQKLWKFWKDTLLTALIMFPIIMAFIASGKALSRVAAASEGSTTLHIVSVIAYFAPYFLLPFAFKLAGGLMSTVFSIANDRSRGIFDKGRKKRQAIREDRMKRAGQNQLWAPGSKIQSRLHGNTLASIMADPKGNAAVYGRNLPGFRRAGAKIMSQLEHAEVNQTQELAKEANATFNDKAYRAVNGALHAGLTANTRRRLREANLLGKSPNNLAEFNEIARILGESEDQTERIASNALHGFAGRAATLYQDPEMGKANIAGMGMLGLASHGFMNERDLVNGAKVLQGGTAQFDANGNFTEVTGTKVGRKAAAQAIAGQAQLLGSRSRPDLKNGYPLTWNEQLGTFENALAESHVVDPEGNVQVRNDSLRALELVGTQTADDIGGAKGGIYKGGEEGIGDAYKFILTQGNTANARQAQARIRNLTDEQRRAAKQQGNENYNDMKLAYAADQYAALVQKFQQIVGPYSRASTDNTTAARSLIADAAAHGLDPEAFKKELEASAAEVARRGAEDEARRRGGEAGLGGPPDMGGGGMPSPSL